jgi:hypothetical protein
LRFIAFSGIGAALLARPIVRRRTTGSPARDAEVNRVLAVLGRYARAFASPDEATARLAGSLSFAARTDDGIDALVAAEAARVASPTVVLTSDPTDLQRLLLRSAHVSVQRV